MMQRANIVRYPLVVRCPFGSLAPCGFERTESEYSTRDFGTAAGGRGFSDARDLKFALRAAKEDLSSSCTLGYYPTEEMLDGKYHNITVKPRNKDLVLHYRSGYLATKVALPAPAPTADALFEGRTDSARIGLTAQAAPVAQHPGFYEVRVTVDIHLERKDGHFTGAFDLSIPDPSAKFTVHSGTVAVDLTDQQFAEALEKGIPVSVTGAEAERGGIRVMVRDRTIGIAGSLRIPMAKQ